MTKYRKIKEIKFNTWRDLINFSGATKACSGRWCVLRDRARLLIRSLRNASKSLLGGMRRWLCGSGWVWLCYNSKDEVLVIRKTHNQEATCMKALNVIPILGLVWEHAYYLKYKSVRPKYVSNWGKVINWDLLINYSLKLRSNTKSSVSSRMDQLNLTNLCLT